MTPDELDPTFRRALESGESVEGYIEAGGLHVLITDRRVAVAMAKHLALNVPIDDLRRVEFDVERGRPASIVLVPENPKHQPQVIAVPVENYDAACEAVTTLGRRIYNKRTA